MTCIAASIPKIPIPVLDLLLPTLRFGIPPIGIDLCCNFQMPFLPLDVAIPIGALLAPLAPLMDRIMTFILNAIDVINSYLDYLQFSFSCPLD